MDADEAIDEAQVRLDILRERLAADPETQLPVAGPDLAALLADLADQLSLAGRHDEAALVGLERVGLGKALARSDPHRFRPLLAETQLDLGRLYTAARRGMAAFAQVDRAVAVFRQLAKDRPDRHRADLARALAERAVIEVDLRHGKAALTSAEEAVAIRRALAAANPRRSPVPLVRALAVLGMCRQAAGEAAASEAYREAIALLLDPAAERPLALAPLLTVLVGRYRAAAGAAADADLLASARRRLDAASPRDGDGGMRR